MHMKTPHLAGLLCAALLFPPGARAADRFTLTVVNDSGMARAAETVVVAFADVKARLPRIVFDQVEVRDAQGRIVPAQVTAFRHVHKGPPRYDDLVFQHDFGAGETAASFTVGASPRPVPPFAPRVFVRAVPERYDDIAWENDRIAHRIYGPGLELPSAGKDQQTSSGIDVWSKRVPYLVVDHWYHKGHDGLHTDTGEGLDMYDVNTYRGCGGTGVWDGRELHVSRNWRTERILANGPVRAVFEVGYEPWDAGDVGGVGNGVMVSETKRFIVDAGHNLDEIDSTFSFSGSRQAGAGELTVAIGLTTHASKARLEPSRDDRGAWMGLWEEYQEARDGKLGTGIVLGPGARFAGFTETPHDRLILVKVRSGETLRYLAGAGWEKSGDFPSSAAWTAYLRECSRRLASPVRIVLPPLNP
jgi:hypothetical protein